LQSSIDEREYSVAWRLFLFRENVSGVAIRLLVISLDGLDGASELKLGLRTSPSTARSEPSPGPRS
jgi:hypothetical protein